MVRRTISGSATMPSVTIVSSISHLRVLVLRVHSGKSQQREEGECNLVYDMHWLFFAARQPPDLHRKERKRHSRESEECNKVLWLELAGERLWSAVRTLGLAMLAPQRYEMPFCL